MGLHLLMSCPVAPPLYILTLKSVKGWFNQSPLTCFYYAGVNKCSSFFTLRSSCSPLGPRSGTPPSQFEENVGSWPGDQGRKRHVIIRERSSNIFLFYLQETLTENYCSGRKCYLASKEDFSMHVFSKDVVSLPTSSRFHEAVGHL